MRPHLNQPVTVFSPGGRLLQVEYAQNSVRQGSTAVGIRGHNCVVMALEQSNLKNNQEAYSARRIFEVNKNLIMCYAGLKADARVLINRARNKCERHNTIVEYPPNLKKITKFIANVQLKQTLIPDTRPFGVSCLVGGFDPDSTPRLYQTDPDGNFYELAASAIGRAGRTAHEFVEARYCEEAVSNRAGTIKLAISALLAVARRGRTNFEVSVLNRDYQLESLDDDMVAEYVDVIERDMERGMI